MFWKHNFSVNTFYTKIVNCVLKTWFQLNFEILIPKIVFSKHYFESNNIFQNNFPQHYF